MIIVSQTVGAGCLKMKDAVTFLVENSRFFDCCFAR